MSKKVEYQAGVSGAWIVNDEDVVEYDCGPMQSARISKTSITALGVMDPGAVVVTHAAESIHRTLGTKGGLGGLLIAYIKDGSTRLKLATITIDFGHAECLELIDELVEELGDRYVGTGTRDQLMKIMGVSRMKENLIIAALILGLLVFGYVMTMS